MGRDKGLKEPSRRDACRERSIVSMSSTPGVQEYARECRSNNSMQVQVQERRESTCIYSGTLDIGWSEVESAGNVRGGGRESHVLHTPGK